MKANSLALKQKWRCWIKSWEKHAEWQSDWTQLIIREFINKNEHAIIFISKDANNIIV